MGAPHPVFVSLNQSFFHPPKLQSLQLQNASYCYYHWQAQNTIIIICYQDDGLVFGPVNQESDQKWQPGGYLWTAHNNVLEEEFPMPSGQYYGYDFVLIAEGEMIQVKAELGLDLDKLCRALVCRACKGVGWFVEQTSTPTGTGRDGKSTR